MDSKREKILQSIQAALETITIANGYEVDLLRVSRVPSSPFSSPLFPCAMVYDLGEEKEQGNPVQFTNCYLHLEIIFWNNEYIDMSQRAIQIESSIEKALGVDTNRGGLAIRTHVSGNTFLLDEEIFPYGGGTVRVEIEYRHKLYDPYLG